MPKGKRKAKDEEEFLAASVHFGGILSAYQGRADRVAIVEAELSRLFSEYKEKSYGGGCQGLKPGKEGG